MEDLSIFQNVFVQIKLNIFAINNNNANDNNLNVNDIPGGVLGIITITQYIPGGVITITQVGYCQGSAFIVGLLLMQVSTYIHIPYALFLSEINQSINFHCSQFSDARRRVICSAGSNNG